MNAEPVLPSAGGNDKRIKLLIMDVDGTLTDGKLYISERGEVCKAFNAKDGYGIRELLPMRGVTPAIITGRTSGILERRCEELGIANLFQGVKNKVDAMRKLLSSLALRPDRVAYIGDDDNDLDVMRATSLAGCPADASARVREAADFIAARNGGEGAVREFIEWMVENHYI
ncbi:MAG: HAD hydrolase family protein [Clostridiales Family XIII bacterium]|jgi:3-deoxy-D-manno-octulosonate 8-phosphate phosphatase (KDO 8-P phosphatase)|nr:HAD hydrolase family protein [Clostridiales Family XIII bacterium]